MRKIIIGFVSALILFFGFQVLAKTSSVNVPWYAVNQIQTPISFDDYGVIDKTFDEDSNVVCYSMVNGSNGSAISCLKNN